MRRLSGLLCTVLVALSPVRASAFDVDWKYVGRFVSEHGCEAAIAMIGGRWTDEALAIAREAGKRYGCSWAVDKLFGPAPDKQTCSTFAMQRALTERSECKTDLDCMALTPSALLGVAGTEFEGTERTRCEHSEICGVPKGYCVPKEKIPSGTDR
jgi:hypothetical protein